MTLRVGLGLLLLLAAAGTAQADEKLIPADLRPKTDRKGFRWDLSLQGFINNGTNYCFNRAMVLTVNGSGFSVLGPIQMTRDKKTFVYVGRVFPIQVTRRVRIDHEKGVVQWVETFKNMGPQRAKVRVKHYSRMSRACNAVLTNTGRRLGTSTALAKGEYGVVAYQSRGFPSAIFCLSSKGSAIKPIVEVQGNQSVYFSYTLQIPRGQSRSVVVTMGQRRLSLNAPPAARTMERMLKPFSQRAWLGSIPQRSRATVVNYGTVASPSESSTAMLEEVRALREAFDVPAGKLDTLFLEEDSRLQGRVVGQTLKVTTRFGATEVGLDEVAVLRGGNGIGRMMQLYLRSGEVLTGDISLTAGKLALISKVGLEVKLDPKGIDAMFLAPSKRDGKRDERTEATVRLHDGTKLTLVGLEAATLQATCPWGPVSVTLDRVAKLIYASEPYPGLWLTLSDGSRYPIAPHQDPLRIKTLRFGAVELHPSAIAGLVSTKPAKQTVFDKGGGGPHCLLIGASRLVGDLAGDHVELLLKSGETTPLDVRDIKLIEQSNTEGRPRFEVTLFNGESFRGRFKDRVLTIKTERGLRHVPTGHLMLLRRDGAAEGPTSRPSEDGREDDGAKKPAKNRRDFK